MGTTYEKADQTTIKLVQEVMRQHHPALAHVEANVGTLFYEKYDRDGILVPGLTLHGYPALATVKVTTLKNRVAGHPDAIVVIDRAPWEDRLKPDEKTALVDHELTHLQVLGAGGGFVTINKATGEMTDLPQTDDAGRPKLKLRKHDWQLGGFREIAIRYRDSAIEVQAVRACQDESGQFMWEFAKR